MTLPVAEKPEKAAGVDLDLTDRQLLNVLQSQFPLVRRPYLAVAEKMSSTEAEIMDRIKKLRKKNVLRQIGAIFDTRRIDKNIGDLLRRREHAATRVQDRSAPRGYDGV
ncbi:MAG: Lrp/AsnC family transcriptional regulator [Chloroflexi bacterium]|nr:Lrp/AsnC family transcriptional regulator [Chloroflexota bacterium]